MTIDIVSVILVIALCGLYLCVATGLAIDWRAPEPGTLWWIAGFMALATGFCVNGLQRILPPLLGLTGGTTLIVAGAGALLIGVQRFLGAPLRFDAWVAAAIGANASLSVVFLLVWPSVNLRIAISNGILPVILAALAWVMLRHAPPRMIAPARLTAAVALLMAALLLVRAVLALASPPMETALNFSLINVLVYFGAAKGQLAIGLGCYFMLMIRRTAALEALTTTDPLTGALNRRGLDLAVMRVEHDFHRHATQFAVIAMDLDHFKRVNDTHGHAAGDVVLRRLAAECAGNLRGDSVIARIGGEEFCILLPNCVLDDARTVAERMRHSFEIARIQAAGAGIFCTVSMGVAQSAPGASDFASVIRAADAALYRAKERGRNRVEAGVA